jgi:DNA polymerase-1
MLAQLDWLREVVRAHGLPLFEVEGYEADDVIGTLARQAEAAGYEVLIVTGDKDLMQLVDEKVRLYNVFKKGVDLVLQGVDEVREKFGTDPEHVVDVLALMGDSSDNVPGVKGIGEKGAIKLIQEWGSVEGVLEHLDEVKGKAKEKLAADRENLLMSLDLVTLRTDVPLDPGFEALGPPDPDRAQLAELFKRLGFQSLLQKLEGDAPAEEEARDYRVVRTKAELEEMVAELREAGAFAFDTETTSLFPLQAELVGASFCAEPLRAWYVPFNLDPPVLPGGAPALLEALAPLWTDPELDRCAQNWKYDALVLAAAGVRTPPPRFDTMVASYCTAGATRRHDLDSLALRYLGVRKIPTTELIGRGAKQITMDRVPVDQVGEYACEDVDVTLRLRERLEAELDEEGARELFETLEMPLVPVLAALEERGIRVDVDHLAGLAEEFEGEIRAAEHDVQELAGENFKVNSPKALGEILFEKLRIQDEAGVQKPKRTKTGWATDHETLTSNYGDVPIVRRVLEYREVSKLKSTYLDALPRYVNPRTGRVHCSFSQVTAATGRLASSDPNLQNIPVRTERGRRLREAFVPREPDERGDWVLLAADYSQVELRILAHFADDERMQAAFAEGHDIHSSTAQIVFDVPAEKVDRLMRSRAKAINFGLMYGMGPQRLGRETGLSLPEARRFIERYFESFPKIRAWRDGVLESARELGYVETLLGRRRRIPDIESSNARMRAAAENTAVNTPVQGSAADIIKRAMIDIERDLAESDLACVMLLQVHDELVFELPERELDAAKELVRRRMEGAVELRVPLVVDFGAGRNWLEEH